MTRPPGFHRDAHRHEDGPEHAHPHHHGPAGEASHAHSHGTGWERYSWLVSPVHALDARAKVAYSLALVLAVVLLPAPRLLELAAFAAFLLTVAVAARLPLRFVLLRSAVVLPIVGAVALFAPLQQAGVPLTPSGFALAYSDGGWIHAYAVVVRAWCAAAVMVLLSTTTPAPELLDALRRFRAPQVVLTLIGFTYRFTGVLASQLASLRRALASRAPDLGVLATVRLFGRLAGNLFVRAYERGERIHGAMLSRGYDGALPVASMPSPRPADALAGVLTIAVITAMGLYQ